jgi:hypothetical protein
MNLSTKDEIKGSFHEVKGKVKETAGKVANNPNLQAETSRTSQCNRNRRSRSHSPRVHSRNQRNTIKSRRRLRLQWI